MNRHGPNIHWIDPSAPATDFPDPRDALDDPNGLLAIGGDLSPERLLAAYRRGIFPWFSEGQPILWWSPDPRAVLFPDEFHASRSLRRTLRKNRFTVSVDRAFDAVIAACADRGEATGTWITAGMSAAYRRLHATGHAHSVETWHDGQLVGGLYGVGIGRVFFGESMFSREADASKAALASLAGLCRESAIELIDCQVASEHLARLGSREIPRSEFSRYLARWVGSGNNARWLREPTATDRLLTGPTER